MVSLYMSFGIYSCVHWAKYPPCAVSFHISETGKDLCFIWHGHTFVHWCYARDIFI